MVPQLFRPTHPASKSNATADNVLIYFLYDVPAPLFKIFDPTVLISTREHVTMPSISRMKKLY